MLLASFGQQDTPGEKCFKKLNATVHVHMVCLIHRATYNTTIPKVDHNSHQPTTHQLTNKVGKQFREMDFKYFFFHRASFVAIPCCLARRKIESFKFQLKSCQLGFRFFNSPPSLQNMFFFVCYGNVRIFNLVVCFDCFLFQILDLILLKQRSIKQTRAKTLHP